MDLQVAHRDREPLKDEWDGSWVATTPLFHHSNTDPLPHHSSTPFSSRSWSAHFVKITLKLAAHGVTRGHRFMSALSHR
jgi:hypothetical protein